MAAQQTSLDTCDLYGQHLKRLDFTALPTPLLSSVSNSARIPVRTSMPNHQRQVDAPQSHDEKGFISPICSEHCTLTYNSPWAHLSEASSHGWYSICCNMPKKTAHTPSATNNSRHYPPTARSSALIPFETLQSMALSVGYPNEVMPSMDESTLGMTGHALSQQSFNPYGAMDAPSPSVSPSVGFQSPQLL